MARRRMPREVDVEITSLDAEGRGVGEVHLDGAADTWSIRNWAIPAAATVQAMTGPGAPVSGTTMARAAMKNTLSKTGAAAAAAKR